MRRSFLPELLSMNLMMAGMAPVMTFMMMGRDMRATWPGEPLFWFVMSMGVIAGFILAYPVNVWLVAKQTKHGLMTVRSADTAPGETAAAKHDMAAMGSHDMAAMKGGAKRDKAHAAASEKPSPEHGQHHAAPPTAKATKTAATKTAATKTAATTTAATTTDVTKTQLAAITGCTFLALLAGMYVPATRVNFRLSAEDVKSAIMPPGMITTPDSPLVEDRRGLRDQPPGSWTAPRSR